MGKRQLSNTRRLKKSNYISVEYIAGIALIVVGYILLHDLLGGTLLKHNAWDSYTLQALAWLDGKTGLGQPYSYLELAEYAGDWFVSFPPFPSVVMLPFAAIFGQNTPSNFIIMLATLATITFAYLCFKKIGSSSIASMFWAVFAVLGSNMLWMSTMGGVWFMAQELNLLLCFAALFCFLCKKRMLCLALLALAVGCRPFSAIFLVLLFALMCIEDCKAGEKPVLSILKNLKHLIIPAIIAIAYMWYNYIRFADPLEFGHNYLPEFSVAGSEQFSFKYLVENLYRLFRPISISANGRIELELFDGFMFFIANPIFLAWFLYIAIDIIKKRFNPQKALICAGFVANMIALMLHKTLGGWQFGARYTVDLIPFVLLYLLLSGIKKPSKASIIIACFAVMFNLYGALHMHFL